MLQRRQTRRLKVQLAAEHNESSFETMGLATLSRADDQLERLQRAAQRLKRASSSPHQFEVIDFAKQSQEALYHCEIRTAPSALPFLLGS